MTHLNLTGVILSLLMIVPMPASAGSWSTQAVLASNAYSGTIALDANGNMVSVWYQNALPNGTAVNEIWASTAPFGHAWSTPVNISGNIGVASGNPSVRSSARRKFYGYLYQPHSRRGVRRSSRGWQLGNTRQHRRRQPILRKQRSRRRGPRLRRRGTPRRRHSRLSCPAARRRVMDHSHHHRDRHLRCA